METQAARIGVEQVAFPHTRHVVVVNHVHADEPMHRLERCLALEQVERDGGVVGKKELIAAAKKFRAVWSRRAYATRHRQFPRLEEREVLCRNTHEYVFSNNGHIPLERALAVGVP